MQNSPALLRTPLRPARSTQPFGSIAKMPAASVQDTCHGMKARPCAGAAILGTRAAAPSRAAQPRSVHSRKCAEQQDTLLPRASTAPPASVQMSPGCRCSTSSFTSCRKTAAVLSANQQVACNHLLSSGALHPRLDLACALTVTCSPPTSKSRHSVSPIRWSTLTAMQFHYSAVLLLCVCTRHLSQPVRHRVW